ncbi:unnamed protein product, partial [Phaeothamnion confervicola]
PQTLDVDRILDITHAILHRLSAASADADDGDGGGDRGGGDSSGQRRRGGGSSVRSGRTSAAGAPVGLARSGQGRAALRLCTCIMLATGRPAANIGGEEDGGGSGDGKREDAAPAAVFGLPQIGPYPAFDGSSRLIRDYQLMERQRVVTEETDAAARRRLAEEMRRRADELRLDKPPLEGL